MQNSSYAFPTFLLMIAILIAPVFSSRFMSGDGPKKDTYQAVFLGKGDLVYYGHLRRVGDAFVTLSDVYYLRQNPSTTDPKTGETIPPKTALDLVKYGNQETYRPQDTLHIPADQILYWTNLLADSPVIAAINQAKQASESTLKND